MPSSRGWDVQTCQGGGDPTGQGSKRLRLGAGRQPQAGVWEGCGWPQRRKDVIYLISHSTMERMEEKNSPGAHRLGEMLSGQEALSGADETSREIKLG